MNANDVCPVRPEDFENTGMLASTARADLYLFHLTEAMANRSSSQDAGFESLAGVTGAEFVRLTASPQAAVSRLLRETASYYVATFEPEPSERNGQTYRVDLRTSREKVKLRTRPAVEIRKDIAQDRGLAEGHAAHGGGLQLICRSARRATPPARPAATRSRSSPLFETLDASAALAAASVGLFDEKNTLKKQWTAQCPRTSRSAP